MPTRYFHSNGSECLKGECPEMHQMVKEGEEPPTVDMVNHPPHYKGPIHIACGQPIECIDVIRSMPLSVGTSVKYAWRAGKKVLDRPAREAEIEDLRKAIWYLQDRIEELGREDD